MAALWLAVAVWMSFLHIAEPGVAQREHPAQMGQQTVEHDGADATQPADRGSSASAVDLEPDV